MIEYNRTGRRDTAINDTATIETDQLPPFLPKIDQQSPGYSRTNTLTPFLKWAGGKEQELKYILPLLPSFDHYYEPFVGGGAVFFSLQANKSFINDKSLELCNLYQMIAQTDQAFFNALDILLQDWQRVSDIVDANEEELVAIYQAYSDNQCSIVELRTRLLAFIERNQCAFENMFVALFSEHIENFLHELERNLFSKTRRMKEIENKKWKLPENDVIDNLECALKSAFYMHVRHLYNHAHRYEIPASLASALFFFVRENAYASMFRYNRRGEFNVPYGGISYNRKDLARKVAYMRSNELKRYLNQTIIDNLDFEEFLQKYQPQANDFIFLDPPYDSEFSTYARNEFTTKDQERLARYLLERCPAKFMVVIKNTPVISRLYDHPALTIRAFDKKYLVSFQDRNDRDVEHLIITNY
jgi:DNA adenine methylase